MQSSPYFPVCFFFFWNTKEKWTALTTWDLLLRFSVFISLPSNKKKVCSKLYLLIAAFWGLPAWDKQSACTLPVHSLWLSVIAEGNLRWLWICLKILSLLRLYVSEQLPEFTECYKRNRAWQQTSWYILLEHRWTSLTIWSLILVANFITCSITYQIHLYFSSSKDCWSHGRTREGQEARQSHLLSVSIVEVVPIPHVKML